MKHLLYITGWMIISLHCGFAQTIKDPIQNYLTSRDINRDPMVPNLKRLFVIKCDLDNSGKLSMLLSFNGNGGRQGNYWTAYLPTSGGYVKADDSGATLTFRRDTFFVGSVGGKYGLLAYAPGKGGGDLNLFQVVNGAITEQKIGSLYDSKPQDEQQFETYFGKAPNWKSLTNYQMKTMNLADLKGAGYDGDAAIKAAQAANHPLHKPLATGPASSQTGP